MAYRLVIFDFDGTLSDSAAWMRRTINQVADRYRFKRIQDHEFALLRGRDNRAIVRHLGVPAWKMPLIANHMRKRMGARRRPDPLVRGRGRPLVASSRRGRDARHRHLER